MSDPTEQRDRYGHFSADGREYVIYLDGQQQPPAPWINVVANEEFGFLVSEALSAYVKVDILFDETYVAARRPAGVRPGLDRTAYLGVTFSL